MPCELSVLFGGEVAPPLRRELVLDEEAALMEALADQEEDEYLTMVQWRVLVMIMSRNFQLKLKLPISQRGMAQSLSNSDRSTQKLIAVFFFCV
jgi:hypothetical protein